MLRRDDVRELARDELVVRAVATLHSWGWATARPEDAWKLPERVLGDDPCEAPSGGARGPDRRGLDGHVLADEFIRILRPVARRRLPAPAVWSRPGGRRGPDSSP